MTRRADWDPDLWFQQLGTGTLHELGDRPQRRKVVASLLMPDVETRRGWAEHQVLADREAQEPRELGFRRQSERP